MIDELKQEFDTLLKEYNGNPFIDKDSFKSFLVNNLKSFIANSSINSKLIELEKNNKQQYILFLNYAFKHFIEANETAFDAMRSFCSQLKNCSVKAI